MPIPGHQASVSADASHPMRIITRRAAGLEGAGWDDAARAAVEATFDELASVWHTRVSPEREAVVIDALERGVEGAPGGLVAEVGSGIGTYSPRLAEKWDDVLSFDLSLEMLRHSPSVPGKRVQADASRLPLADGVVDAVVLINMLLFPDEVDRVLAPRGLVVWVNSSGEETPIHLTPTEVAEVLPGAWEGVQSRAGVGLWCVLHRTGGA